MFPCKRLTPFHRLAASLGQFNQLGSHVTAALNDGVTETEIQEVVLMITGAYMYLRASSMSTRVRDTHTFSECSGFGITGDRVADTTQVTVDFREAWNREYSYIV
jgi:hypothetical protein